MLPKVTHCLPTTTLQKQRRYLTHIDNVIAVYDVDKIYDELYEIREYVLTNGSEDDKHIVITAVEIAEESIMYWHEYYSEWEELRIKEEKEISETKDVDKQQNKNWFSWKKVVRDDIKGAVRGVVRGGVISAITGPALLTLSATTIAADAISSSAISAGEQLIDHLVK